MAYGRISIVVRSGVTRQSSLICLRVAIVMCVHVEPENANYDYRSEDDTAIHILRF
jgi:hypothetical protein